MSISHTDDSPGPPESDSSTARALVEAEQQRIALDLAERIKESGALYAAVRTLSRGDLVLDERLLLAAEQIVAGWRYPEVTECRVVIGERSYETHGYRETEWHLRRALPADAGSDGFIVVCYTEARPEADVGPFLHEEATLLEMFAHCVANSVRQERLEVALRESQPLQTVGRLAGGVAHDFNNLLTGIGGLAHLLLLDTPEDDARHADLKEILRSTDRAAQLTRQLLAFSRRKEVQPEDLDAAAVVRGFAPMLQRMAGSNVDLTLEVTDEPAIVHIDEAQLEQVLLNLVANARDAMPEGGSIRIAMEHHTLDERDAADAEAPLLPGEYALLVVTDSGEGMDEQTLARAFEPFYTTRRGGRGSGMGLSTARDIVVQANGRIEASSDPGAGATFRILLPLVGSRSGAVGANADSVGTGHERSPVETSAGQGGGDGVVLVVDDDVAVGQLVARILERAGERVRIFENPFAAVEALEQSGLQAKAMVTDVAMPGMNGLELRRRVSELRPDLPVLLMSGYVSESARAEAARLPFIRKPFSPESLLQRLRELLQGETSDISEEAE